MKVIIVTGSVASGKTTLAKALSKKLSYRYIDANKIIRKYKISEGYDKKRKSKIIDIKKLNKYLIKEINDFKSINKKQIIKKANNKKTNENQRFSSIQQVEYIKKNKKIKNKKNNGIIIDSHLSHYLPKKYVDLCIVTKCDLKILEKRLKKRGYNKNKIRENLDAEIFDVCLSEAKEKKHRVIVMDLTKDINKALDSIIKNLKKQ